MLAVLQFDSTSVPLVKRMLAQRRLPALAEVRERGRSYELDPGSTPLFPSAAYPTLYSGVEIADHGIYSAFPWFPTEQRVRFMRSLRLPRTVWERLPPGRRALVIDPYDNWPPSSGEGLFISGWQYRNRVAALERWSVPEDAHQKLSRRFGAPPLLEDAYGAQPARRLLEARRHLIAGHPHGSRRSSRICSRASASTSSGRRSAPVTSRATFSGIRPRSSRATLLLRPSRPCSQGLSRTCTRPSTGR